MKVIMLDSLCNISTWVSRLSLVTSGLFLLSCTDTPNTNVLEENLDTPTLQGEVLISGIAYLLGAKQVHNLQSLDFAAPPKIVLSSPIHPKEHDDLSGRFAQNGTKVLFVSMRNRTPISDTSEIYVLDFPSGQNVTRLTNNTSLDDESPDWCSGPERVLYNQWDLEFQSSAIKSMNIDGSQKTTLISQNHQDTEPKCSSDGTRFSFTREVTGSPSKIFMSDIDGQNIKALTPDSYDCFESEWSPDDTWIVAACDDTSDTLFGQLYKFRPSIDPQTGYAADFQQITTVSGVLLDGQPVWSPDGTQIIFNRSTGTLQSFEAHVLNLNDGTIAKVPHMQKGDWIDDWK